jgi:hypothetical protein
MPHLSTVFRLLTMAIGLCSLETYAQERERDPRYEFAKENGKPKFLKKYRDIEIHLKDSLPMDHLVSRTHIVSGYLLYTTPDSLVIDYTEERWSEVHWEDKYHSFPWWKKAHTFFEEDTMEIPRKIALDRIDLLTYQRNTAGMGAAITFFSAVGLLIYAPLKAMKFKDGTFDGEKYIQVATPWLIGVGVGLVVMPFTEGKRRVRVKVGT